jgi:nitrilase
MSNAIDPTLTVGLAQIAPRWLQKTATIRKVTEFVAEAARSGCSLVAFGEALVPGYPFWVERTDGARFDSAIQKKLYAQYLAEAVCPAEGDLDPVCAVARDNDIAVYLGIIERAADRGGHSLYCSMVYIDRQGIIGSVHRKLMPTYEERLVWSIGDGNGLRTHKLGPFTMGGLNCWENWLPLARAALYGQGEDLHVAIWPGNVRNTGEITRFIAMEARSYVMSVSGLMRPGDIDSSLPNYDILKVCAEETLADGGSCLADPAGNWVLEPATGDEELRVAEIDQRRVNEERQSLDPSGHYSRPDVTKLIVNRQRQATIALED